MKLVKSGETRKTVTFESDAAQGELFERMRTLISKSEGIDPLYVFRDPLYVFRHINYAGATIGQDNAYIRKSATTPAILIDFGNPSPEKSTITFRVSYWPVFLWAFYASVPATGYFMYQALKADHSKNAVLLGIGFSLLIWSFIGLLAFAHEKSVQYFFKRDVNRIVRDLAAVASN